MIEAENLLKDYGPIRAVDDVTFKVEKGDILGFLGPNGAGKSTTMKMITGFLPPTSGTARVGGHDIKREPIAAKKLFGYLPENGPLYDEMTVMEFLNFIADMRELSKKGEKAVNMQRVVNVCHLEDVRNQPIETLSKGFRQRVGMAQALIHDPPCLIMDEPTDGLDPNQKQTVRQLIASMAEDKAIILSTHILEEVEAMCNRVIIIAKGKILVDESPQDLRRRHPRHNALILTLDEGEESPVMDTLKAQPDISDVVRENGHLVVIPEKGKTADHTVLTAAREQNWKLSGVEKHPVKLDEVFRELTQAG